MIKHSGRFSQFSRFIPSLIQHPAIIIVLLLVVGALVTWWMVERADGEMRAELLLQTRLVAQAVKIERVRNLTGTATDLTNADYLWLKEQLAAVRVANPQCRFVYLVGHKADGKLFFFVDSEPADSKDYSPPGQIYEEAPAAYSRVFATRTASVEGPVTDRWGTWVSALVPLTAPQTGAAIAVLGMDIDARAWKWRLASQAIVPAGLMLVLLIFVGAAFASTRRVDPSQKLLIRNMLFPFMTVVLLLTAGAAALLWNQHRQQFTATIIDRTSKVSNNLLADLDKQAIAMTRAALSISADANVRKALKNGNTNHLMAAWRSVYKTLGEEHSLTHFYFFDKKLVGLLRVHMPGITYSEKNSRFTALQAQRTGKTASGIELGTLSTFTLRVVQPIFEGGNLIGYLELSKEIKDVVRTLPIPFGTHLAVVIRKANLNEKNREDGMITTGTCRSCHTREADWDRMARSVIIYSSHGRLPDAFLPWADYFDGDSIRGEPDRDVAFDGKDWWVSATPLQDASGKEIGNLLYMSDISAEKQAFTRLLIVGGATGTILLSLILGFTYVLIKRTDASIRLQQAALQQSEEKHRSFIESSHDGYFEIDLAGNLTFFNESQREMLGYSKEELMGMNNRQYVDKENAKKVFVAFQEIYETGIAGTVFDCEIMRKDGTKRQVEVSASLEKDSSGNPIEYRGITRDVTERKKMEEVMRQSEEKYRTIIDEMESGYLELDLTGNFTFVNDEACRHSGYSREEMIGSNFRRQVSKDEVEKMYETFGRIYTTGKPERGISYQLLRKDGSTAYAEMAGFPLKNQKGEIIGFRGLARDITARKQAEDKLRDGEERLRSITDSANDAIIMMDPRGTISFWNQAAATILGYRAEEAIGQNLHSLLTPERYLEAHHAAFPEFLKTGRGNAIGKTLELAAKRKDGQEIAIALSLSSVLLSGDWYAVGIISDITSRKQAEDALKQTNIQLEDAIGHANQMTIKAELANIAKSDFLANMSHEIRTPMNGVMGMTSLLLETELSDEQRKYAGIVQTSGESLLAILNDILDFSKMEAGKVEIETLDFDLHALLDDFAAVLALRAQDKGLEFICAAAPDVPSYLRGDPGRLRQILTNLTGNAVKFTHQGEIAVRAKLQAETDTDAVVRFSVKDTGIGIPENKQALMFQKFTQADTSTTRQYGGTGLGLAISKQLVELMGGEIGLISKGGHGSEFWFTVRLSKQAVKERDIAPTADIRNLHVLVVDDNATNREILMIQFAAWGVRGEEAPDSASALKSLYRACAEADPFRIAIIDMQMPVMDGAELALVIKADEKLKDTSLVLLTSLGQRGDAKKMEQIGFSAYLTKPTRQSEMFACLAAVLTGSALPQSSQSLVTRHSIREMNWSAVRILLAEDNVVNQQVAMGILKKLGLRADIAANGAEAVKALETVAYDLVLMDMQMPVLNGIEATKQIRNPRSAVKNHAIPIIAMTANAMQGDREKCLKAGMNDYVSKPVSPKALAEALEKWLPKGEESRPKEDRLEAEVENGLSPAGASSPADAGRGLGVDEGRKDEYPVENRLKAEGEHGETRGESIDSPPFLKGDQGGFWGKTTHSEPDVPVFDKAGLMERVMDDEELAQTLIQVFLDDIPAQIEILRGFLAAGDITGAEHQSHTIKGASANVGGEALRAVSFEMEKAAKAGNLEAVKSLLPEMEAQFGMLKEEMGMGCEGTEAF